MKIGIDACCWANRRGFGRFTRDLLTALVSNDKTNEFLFFVDENTATNNNFPKDVKTLIAPTRVPPTEAASASGRRSLRDMWALTRLVMKSKVDLFFFPAVYSYFPILNRTKIIVTIHDMIAEHNPELIFPDKKLKFFWKVKQNLAIRQADLILTVSEYSQRQIIEFFNLPESQVKAISEAASPIFTVLSHDRNMTKILNRYQLVPGKRFLLYVGGISPHKNLKALVEASHQLISNAAFSDLKLVLVGDYKSDSFYSNYSALKLYVKEIGFDNKVIFTGFVPDEDLVYIYNAASLLVFPSLEEGFGLPAIEAMACGLPVAASDRGSLPEILAEAGRYFDPYSRESMTRVIKDILKNAALSSKMSQVGLSRSKDFRWEAIAQKTISIFTEVVTNSRKHV